MDLHMYKEKGGGELQNMEGIPQTEVRAVENRVELLQSEWAGREKKGVFSKLQSIFLAQAGDPGADPDFLC